jgi:hypothetical protein
VNSANPLGGYIEQFMDDGNTAGCATNPLRFCPKSNVTRADMALFLYRSFAFENIFTDVPKTNWAAPEIERIYRSGITTGCAQNPFRYCPDRAATRAEAITLIIRGKYGATYSPPSPIGIFSDVPVNYPLAAFIEKAYNDGITTGCSVNPLKFCPDSEATRAEAATYFVRLQHGRNFIGSAYKGTFADLPQSHPLVKFVEQFEADALTVGCDVNPWRFCPDRPVTRAEMAVFLTSAFDIP